MVYEVKNLMPGGEIAKLLAPLDSLADNERQMLIRLSNAVSPELVSGTILAGVSALSFQFDPEEYEERTNALVKKARQKYEETRDRIKKEGKDIAGLTDDDILVGEYNATLIKLDPEQFEGEMKIRFNVAQGAVGRLRQGLAQIKNSDGVDPALYDELIIFLRFDETTGQFDISSDLSVMRSRLDMMKNLGLILSPQARQLIRNNPWVDDGVFEIMRKSDKAGVDGSSESEIVGDVVERTRRLRLWKTGVNTLRKYCVEGESVHWDDDRLRKGGVGMLGWLDRAFVYSKEISDVIRQVRIEFMRGELNREVIFSTLDNLTVQLEKFASNNKVE